MRDSEVVASIVAGDPEGLAEAYDRYADALFGYCRSLLREPADAADAVQDTFVIAASKLTRLRDPERLRAWLFAVARNECMHRLRSRQATPLQDIPDQPDDSEDVGVGAEREEARALMRAAVGGLNDSERDVINQLWHGLEVPEVATVLGVSRNHAYSLFSRAREQLEASLAVLVVGRSGRKDCATLDRLLSGWDGRLTTTLRKRVGRHIDRCLVCSDRRRQELQPAMLLSLTPALLLALAVVKDPVRSLAGAATRLAGPPSGLRTEILRLATSTDPHAVALRAGAGRSTRSFGMNGFPKPLHHGHFGLTGLPHLPLGVAGGTAAAATATVIVTAVGPYAHHGPPPTSLGTATVTVVPTPATALSAMPVALPTGAGRQRPQAAAGFATAESRRVTSSRNGASSSGSATPPVSASTAPTGTGGATPTSTPTPTPTPTPTGTPTPTPTGTGTGTGTPTPTPTASAPPTAGPLTVTPAEVVLSSLLGGRLTLTANDGPVTWSISEPASLIGTLSVSPSSGTVYPGSPVIVTLATAGIASLNATLTVTPGGQAVAVLLRASR
jgi:RNA polymerase sigma factor (sigma-70 family)